MFSSLKRYLQVMFYIFFVLSVDAMNFFLKFVLWVGAESDLLKARVAIWGFTAIIASKEFFEYIEDPNCHRVGPFLWLSIYTLAIEYSIWFKFSRGMFSEPFPWYVVVIIVTYFGTAIMGGVYAFMNEKKDNKKAQIDYSDPDVTIEANDNSKK